MHAVTGGPTSHELHVSKQGMQIQEQCGALACQGKLSPCEVVPPFSITSAASDTSILLLALAALKASVSSPSCCQLNAPAWL